LVSGVCFAQLGNKVICVDKDKEKINMLNKGIMPIYEENLEELCNQNRKNGNIEFTMDLEYAVKKSDIIFIAVGTPSLPSGDADLSQVIEVAKIIARFIQGYKIIVNKSTVPVGTQKLVTQIIKENMTADYDFDVVSNPEFLREGTAIYDTFNTDRVVIGTDSERAAKIMEELHKPFNAPILIVDPESAEMIKYAANAFLATKISFINEIANICERVGANVEDVARGIGLDKRIGEKFLNAGIGYGGACFPKDTKALVKIAEAYGYDLRIVKQVIEVNNSQKIIPYQKLLKVIPHLEGKVIGILGLAFKPNTDDMREAPSIEIIKKLITSGAVVKAYDPVAMEVSKNILKNVIYCNTSEEVFENADAVILVTEWSQFKNIEISKVLKTMNNNIFIDGRNMFDPKHMKEIGFNYLCIGKN
jgi:UDPglucose 6-dehydrogenase